MFENKERERLLREDIRHNILLVNVSRSIKEMPLHEAAKESWIITESNANKIELICPYVNNKIVGTYTKTGCYLAEEKLTKTGRKQKRYGFKDLVKVDYGYDGKDVSDWINPFASSHYCWK